MYPGGPWHGCVGLYVSREDESFRVLWGRPAGAGSGTVQAPTTALAAPEALSPHLLLQPPPGLSHVPFTGPGELGVGRGGGGSSADCRFRQLQGTEGGEQRSCTDMMTQVDCRSRERKCDVRVCTEQFRFHGQPSLLACVCFSLTLSVSLFSLSFPRTRFSFCVYIRNRGASGSKMQSSPVPLHGPHSRHFFGRPSQSLHS